MSGKTIVLVDGENLILRYESLCRSGRIPKDDVVHRAGDFVWHPGICKVYALDILRVSFYSTFVGDDKALEEFKEFISNVKYQYSSTTAENVGSGTINPHIFKKSKRATKTKSVDINISIDALRNAYQRNAYRIILCSGDGDYLPLINEIMHQGTIVHVAAFSKGCHPSMKYAADDFTNLDEVFFK